MHKMHKDTKGKNGLHCNTKNVARERSRNWTFTLNNYTEEDIKSICKIDAKYVFQEEKGENGTPHLQGILMFKNPKTFNGIKKLIPKAHIEKARSKIASIKYCTKVETRNGELYSNCEEAEKYGTKTQKKNSKKILNLEKMTDLEKYIWEQTQLDGFKEIENEMSEVEKKKLDKVFKYLCCMGTCCYKCKCEKC